MNVERFERCFTGLLIESTLNAIDQIVEGIFADIGFMENFVEEIFPIEWRSEESRMGNVQDLTNVIDHFQGRRCRETENRQLRKLTFENRKILVVYNVHD